MRLPGPTGVSGPVSGRKELALCIANALMRGQMSRVDLVTCCACWPGVRRRAVKAEPALTPGRGGAQRSRLDLSTAEFGSVGSERIGDSDRRQRSETGTQSADRTNPLELVEPDGWR